jgi:hypothetical protein
MDCIQEAKPVDFNVQLCLACLAYELVPHTETCFSVVILRIPARSGTTKNLLLAGFVGDSSSRVGRDLE